jgi:hypothetical protein
MQNEEGLAKPLQVFSILHSAFFLRPGRLEAPLRV